MTGTRITLPGLAFLLAVVAVPAGGWADTVEETYRLYCVQCHGTLGNGQGINETAGGLSVSPRDHNSSKEMTKLSDEDLRLAIAEGGGAVDKSGLMPPWGKTLSPEQIGELVLYLRELCKCEATGP